MSKKYTTKEFIEKAKLIHDDKYDYSKVEYINSQAKVNIICSDHGEFWQISDNHLQGHGCPKCGKKNGALYTKLTTKEFIEKAKLIHGNKYNYSKISYINNYTKIKIICPIHGEFWQRPRNHLWGQICLKCSYKKKSLTTKKFIEKIKKIYNEYDYSKVNYKNLTTKIKIICPIHGEFWKRPDVILQGYGCPKCVKGIEEKTNNFIEKAKLIHDDKYDYSKVEYVNSSIKIKIICPIHGEFWQRTDHHLNGVGCPICNESYGEKKIVNYLKDNSISYIRQKTFEECKNKRILSFDFHLPYNNLLIEYDGEQHFKSIEYFGGEKRFKQRKINDSIKNNFAKENNINLLRIPYYEIKNIEEILIETIQ